MIFILYCARLIVSLASPKILPLDNKNKKTRFFILYYARLIVSLQKEVIQAVANDVNQPDNKALKTI